MIDDLVKRLMAGTTENFRDGSSHTISTALEREAAVALKEQAKRISAIRSEAIKACEWRDARIAELEAAIAPIVTAKQHIGSVVTTWIINQKAMNNLRNVLKRRATLEKNDKQPRDTLDDQDDDDLHASISDNSW